MAFKHYNPDTGITETFTKDRSTGKMVVNYSQDVEPFKTSNMRERSEAGENWKGDFHKVASIPQIVIQMWWNELKAAGHPNPNPLAKENHKWFIAKLNSSEFAALRTKEGNI